jgi:uncharacterized protein (DUF1330 family)
MSGPYTFATMANEPESITEALTLSVLLWAHPGCGAALANYEDDVLTLLAEHGATLLSRVRSVEVGEGPTEMHVITFESQQSMDAYLADPRRAAMSERRDAAIARTDIHRVSIVS